MERLDPCSNTVLGLSSSGLIFHLCGQRKRKCKVSTSLAERFWGQQRCVSSLFHLSLYISLVVKWDQLWKEDFFLLIFQRLILFKIRSVYICYSSLTFGTQVSTSIAQARPAAPCWERLLQHLDTKLTLPSHWGSHGDRTLLPAIYFLLITVKPRPQRLYVSNVSLQKSSLC